MEIYVYRDYQQQGSYCEAEILTLADNMEISGEDKLWAEEWGAEWIAAQEGVIRIKKTAITSRPKSFLLKFQPTRIWGVAAIGLLSLGLFGFFYNREPAIPSDFACGPGDNFVRGNSSFIVNFSKYMAPDTDHVTVLFTKSGGAGLWFGDYTFVSRSHVVIHGLKRGQNFSISGHDIVIQFKEKLWKKSKDGQAIYSVAVSENGKIYKAYCIAD